MTVSQTVDIPANRRLTIDVPPEIPAGRAVVTFTPAEASTRGTPVFGCAKGQFWMADDFDAPLEDFKA